MLFLTNFQHVNGSFMKKRTPTKTNDIDEKRSFGHLVGKHVFLQNLFNHIRFYSVAFLILLTTFFFKRILPLHVCSVFTGFLLLTKSSFCTSIGFFKSCKNRGWSFCRPQGFPGRLSALKGDYFAQVALKLDPWGYQTEQFTNILKLIVSYNIIVWTALKTNFANLP